jgi:hypothetical protein
VKLCRRLVGSKVAIVSSAVDGARLLQDPTVSSIVMDFLRDIS